MWRAVDRASNEDDVLTITAPWAISDIVYTAIIGTVMLAAFLEWFLWLAAFLYCLVKAYRKAETTSIRVLAVIVMVLFTAVRAIFLPIMVVTLPLPSQIVRYFPPAMVHFLQWFAFWSFAALLTIPWLFCVYQLVTHSIGRTKRIKHVLDESSAPKVVIVMPCYKEKPDILLRTVDSLVDCEYPPSCLHVFLSFDGDREDELFLRTIEKLGVPLALDSYPKSIDVVYRSTRITVSRFLHGGKRHCQKRTFKLIDRIYTEYLKRNDNLFVLFIDSDCILDRVCIQNFMYEMELKPGSKRNMLAQTGVITSTTEKNSLITLLQDMEYIHGQLFERSVESGCGAVTCLPGALTILRFSAFRKMAKYYFADKAEQCQDLFDYGKCHLGEDRWLTHLFMIGAKERYQIQMNTGAFCKTEAVQEYGSLLKQRRRWFLGFITNEVCMLTDIRLWKRYPLLCWMRFAQNTVRTTALLFFIMVISLLTTSKKVDDLPVGFIGVSLGLNWALMLYFGARLGRYKIMLYPLMFVVNPFFNWVYMVYGIFTAGQRTWGGPRADAGAADIHISPQAAIEYAEAMGDDLNIVPETFRPAAEARAHHCTHVPFLPSEHVEGRFVPAERLADGWYRQESDTGLNLPRGLPQRSARMHLHPRDSYESGDTSYSANDSVYLPRRVESIMDPDDTIKYLTAQAAQRPVGGAVLGNLSSTAFYSKAYTARFPFQSSSSDSSISETSLYYCTSDRSPSNYEYCEDIFDTFDTLSVKEKRDNMARNSYAPMWNPIDGPTSQSSMATTDSAQSAHLSRPTAKITKERRKSPLSHASFTESTTPLQSPEENAIELQKYPGLATRDIIPQWGDESGLRSKNNEPPRSITLSHQTNGWSCEKQKERIRMTKPRSDSRA